MTLDRVRGCALFDAPLIVADASHANAIMALVAAEEAASVRLLLEPASRNTAAAAAFAAQVAVSDELLLLLPSDHVVDDEHAFYEAVRRAIPVASAGLIVTFGIRPTRPDTGYGYIRRGRELGDGVFAADGFVEKPSATAVERLLAEGLHHWNAGIFLARAAVLLAAFQEHAPDVLADVCAALPLHSPEDARIVPDGERFAAIRNVSLDRAVIEKLPRLAVVPVDMGWSDVGSWDAIYDLGDQDSSSNVVRGDVHSLDCAGSLLRSDGIRLVAIGVTDLIVVAAGDRVLVMPRGSSQRARDAAVGPSA